MRFFIEVRAFSRLKTPVLISFIGALMVGWAMTGTTTWAQTPRPTLTAEPTVTPIDIPSPDPTATPSPVSQPQAASSNVTPVLRGQVLDLTTGQPVSGVRVVFSTGDASVEAVSDESGAYAFYYLGAINGRLNAIPSPESGLNPVTADVAVQPRTGIDTVVNLGVSPSLGVAPPLIPTIQLSPNYVSAGENLTITVLVKNTLPNPISGAMVTNWLPNRLVPVSIRSSTGNPYFSDNLAIVELGNLDAAGGALVEIVAQVTGGGTSSSALQGKVSFFYRENVAAQAQAFGHTNGTPPTVLPVTGVGLPVVGLGLIVVVVIVGWMRRRIGRTLPVS